MLRYSQQAGDTRRRVKKLAPWVAASFLIASCGARVQYFAANTSQSVQPGSSNNNQPQIGTPIGPNTNSSGGSHSSTVTQVLGSGKNGSNGQSQTGSASNNGGSQSVGGVTAASMTPSTFPFNPQQQAELCTGSAGNTAAGPGVSPTTITVGNVSGISGLIPSSFKPGYQAVTAAFDAVNRFGGICGRQLKLDVEDDQQSASNNEADVQDLIPKVLAFVGSLSDADNGGVTEMEGANTPDMGPAINTNRSNSKVYWSATGGSLIIRNGRAYIYNTWLNGLKANHDLPSTVAILSYSIPISAQAGEEFATAFEQAGVKICFHDYNIQAGAQGTSIPSDVRTMKVDNCGGVYTTMDVVGNSNMLDAMQNNDYHPQLISTTYEGYTPDQISSAGQSASQGLQVALNSVPLSDQNPGVEMYQQELNTYEPGNSTSEFGLEAWADAEMFIYALLKTGRNPTRASLTNALSQISGWTTDGAFGPYAPRDRTGPICGSDVIVQGNTFIRDWPSSGLYCNGQMIDVGPAS